MKGNETEIERRFQKLNVWKQGGQRAPHKPLLVLLALGRLQQGDPRMLAYADIDTKLRELLQEFGPSRKSYHPEYPFWRLQSDGVWQVVASGDMRRRTASSDVPRTELLAHEAQGGFADDVQRALEKDSRLLQAIARELLDEHFPDTLHGDILDAVGLNLDTATGRRRPRDPEFRRAVLRAYDYRCAVCSLDLRLGPATLGLEAAHIKWHQAGGPDIIPNGLALCAIHHRALDYGAIGLSENLRIRLSGELHGSAGVEEWFLRYEGQPVRSPHAEAMLPAAQFVDWHAREVFRAPERGHVC